KEDVKPTLPIFLSMFILAYSRRHMSKILRSVGGYSSPSDTLFYTDTDSLIVRKSTFTKLMNYKGGKFMGHALGQLEDEFPNDHIVSARFLSPKTYCLALMKKEK